MEFYSFPKIDDSRISTTLVLPFWEGSKHAESAASLEKYETLVKAPLQMGDFKGKEGEILPFYHGSQRVFLVGIGPKEKVNTEKLRRAYSSLAKSCQQKQVSEITLVIPKFSEMPEEDIVKGIAEGLLLSNYVFDQLKHTKKIKSILLKKVAFVGASKHGLVVAKKCGTIAESVYFARDLVNGNADDVTPQHLSKVAKELQKKLPSLKATILNKSEIEKEKLGLLLAVNRGSESDPALIILSYRGDATSKNHTVLIGKGITYDTGGLNLKPSASMETMKADMAGGAAVLGTLYAAASLKLKVNVTAVVPATENSIDAKSFKPGDVYKSCHGHTVEVNNPDAEGRLVLADAITYALKKLHPTRIIDIATLTGGVDVALGAEASGLFSNDDVLADSLARSGANTFERLWRLPLYEEYKESLKSDVADMKNSAGRSASSIVGAMFLQEFVEGKPWAHLDIASTAYLSEKRRYHPKYATGFGVRLLVDFLEHSK
jgi:leucyl aminopeptidase